MKTLKRITLILTINLICPFITKAQLTYYIDEETGEDKMITRQTEKEIINKYLEQNDLKGIEFNPDTNSVYSFRVQEKFGNWILFNSSVFEFVLSPAKYSLDFPNPMFGYEAPITVAKRRKKSYVFDLYGEQLLEQLWFDQIKYYVFNDTSYVWNNVLLEDEIDVNKRYVVALKRKNKWAVCYLRYGEIYQVTPFYAKSLEELPVQKVFDHFRKNNQSEMTGMPIPLLELNQIVNINDYQAMDFNTKSEDGTPIRLQDKKGNWWLFDGFNSNLLGKEGYSISLPNEGCGNFALAERKNKQYFFPLGPDGGYVNEDLWFEDYEYHFYEEYIDVIDEYGNIIYDSNGNLIIDTVKICDYMMLKRDDKWACAFYTDEMKQAYQLSGFHFKSPEEYSDTLFNRFAEVEYQSDYDYESMEIISRYLQENEDIDIAFQIGWYEFTKDESHPMLQVRHAQTKRWSIQITGGFKEETQFPIAASSITRHKLIDDSVFEVWCDEKVGYYYYKQDKDIHQVLPCEYDDFKYVNLDYTYGCALKSNGKWELYHAQKPEKLIEGSADTIDELIGLWLNR